MSRFNKPDNIRGSKTVALDRAANQRFSAQCAPVKISGSSHVVEQKCVGVMKWYMKMSMWETVSLSVWLWVSACRREEQRFTTGLRLNTPRPRSKSEDKTTWYDQEKLCVNMAVNINFPLSDYLSRSTESFILRRIKRDMYFITKLYGSSLIMII